MGHKFSFLARLPISAKSSRNWFEVRTILSAERRIRNLKAEKRLRFQISDFAGFASATAFFKNLLSLITMFSYETLDVYQRAKGYHNQIFKFLKGNKGVPLYVKSQLGRAALSIMLNIEEGNGRFSDTDRRHFYVTTRSSAFECARSDARGCNSVPNCSIGGYFSSQPCWYPLSNFFRLKSSAIRLIKNGFIF